MRASGEREKFGREIFLFAIVKVVPDDLSAPCRQPTTGPLVILLAGWTAIFLGQGRFFMLFFFGKTRARAADYLFYASSAPQVCREARIRVERSIFAC